MTFDKKCPVCGGEDVQSMDEEIRSCPEDGFMWNVLLSEALLLGLAIAHVRKQRGPLLGRDWVAR